MSNVDLFREYLEEINLRFREDSPFDSGLHFFIGRQGLKGGQTVTIAFEFPENEKYVGLRIFDIATIDSPLKRDELLKLINEINLRYRIGKFMVNDRGSILVEWNVMTAIGFNPQLIVEMCLAIVGCIEDEYPKLMKLQWA